MNKNGNMGTSGLKRPGQASSEVALGLGTGIDICVSRKDWKEDLLGSQSRGWN